jgi:hypothetical protein
MRRLLKYTALLCVLFFTFSLLGCASNDNNTHKEAKNEVKTKEVAKKSEQTKVAKLETNEDQKTKQATESVSTKTKEKNTKQTAKKANTNSQNTKKMQANSSVSQAKTSTSSHKSTAPATTKPAATKPITTTAPKPSTTPPTQKPVESVTLSVIGSKDRGTIIGTSKVSFKDGETIFDILLQEAKKHNIVVDSRGSGATTYVEGIDNIYEFDYGAKSGWVFKLNGVSLTKSIGTIKVKDGDRIECSYTE